MNVQIYLNIYDRMFGRLEKTTYICIVNLINEWVEPRIPTQLGGMRHEALKVKILNFIYMVK